MFCRNVAAFRNERQGAVFFRTGTPLRGRLKTGCARSCCAMWYRVMRRCVNPCRVNPAGLYRGGAFHHGAKVLSAARFGVSLAGHFSNRVNPVSLYHRGDVFCHGNGRDPTASPTGRSGANPVNCLSTSGLSVRRPADSNAEESAHSFRHRRASCAVSERRCCDAAIPWKCSPSGRARFSTSCRRVDQRQVKSEERAHSPLP